MRVAFLLCAVALACAGKTVKYSCQSGERVEVSYSTRSAILAVSGKPKIKLASVAAGGRYSDGYTSIWSEGGELVVEAGSVKLKGCAEEGSLAGKWRVVEIGGESIRGELKAPYVEFLAEGRLAGFGGCNRFGGSYEQTGDEIVIGPLAATRMACVGAGMDLEDRFFKGFTGKLRMQRTGGRLELKHEKTVIQLRLYLDL